MSGPKTDPEAGVVGPSACSQIRMKGMPPQQSFAQQQFTQPQYNQQRFLPQFFPPQPAYHQQQVPLQFLSPFPARKEQQLRQPPGGRCPPCTPTDINPRTTFPSTRYSNLSTGFSQLPRTPRRRLRRCSGHCTLPVKRIPLFARTR